MKKILAFALALATMFSLSSCLPFLSGGDPDAVKVVESPESSLTIEVPASWIDLDANPDATIEMNSVKGEQGILVLEESKELFVDGFTLADYASICFEGMSASANALESTEITDVIVGSDIPAKQFEISGDVDGIKSTFLFACFKMGGTYYQLNVWATLSEYDAARVVFDKLIASVNFDPEVLAAEEDAPIASDSNEGSGDAGETQTITSSESGLSMAFPADWYETDDVTDATIEMETGRGDYMVVFENPREDFVDGYTLDEYATAVYENTPSNFEEPEASELIDIAIGAESIPAKQFEISGADAGVISKYQITCAEIDGVFYQFTMVTWPTDYDTFKPVFDGILASVKTA